VPTAVLDRVGNEEQYLLRRVAGSLAPPPGLGMTELIRVIALVLVIVSLFQF
jgi:hypothetical protein